MAEKRVFDRLRSSLNHPADPPMTAFHSLNLTDHSHKRFGDIDFLVCGKPGLVVLEVKGGRVRCRQGVWTYTDRYGVESRSVEGPFKQAESALHGLMAKLRKRFDYGILSRLTIGYGVLFPDCEWDLRGAEWDDAVWLDSRSFNNFENWLQRLFAFWRKKQGEARPTDPSFLKELIRYLRPEFETVETLFSQVGLVGAQVARLTEDQMRFVDVIDANSRVLCCGGAGTGKTFLAMELARRWTYSGKKTVMPCGSKWLKRYLETRFVLPGLTLTTMGALEVAANRAGLQRFDAVIVDEGQDIFNRPSIDLLDRFLKGGLTQGKWCIFHDMNNQAISSNKPDPNVLAYLESLYPAKVPLNTNCRNTVAIIDTVKETLGTDMGVKGAGQGPDVRWKIVSAKKEAVDALAEELSQILGSGHIPGESITILSPLPYEESIVSGLPEACRLQIRVLDEFSMRSFPPAEISFAQIDHFKGLENDVIIVVDLPQPTCSLKEKSRHYVAMSRPRVLLSVIFTAS